jgi:hypothetical protein
MKHLMDDHCIQLWQVMKDIWREAHFCWSGLRLSCDFTRLKVASQPVEERKIFAKKHGISS